MQTLETIFNSVVGMTRIGVVLFLIILIARYMLSRFPKIYSYLLWVVLFIRLIIPINLYIIPSFLTLKNFDAKINTNILQNFGNEKIREYVSNNLTINTFNLNRNIMEYIVWSAIILWIIGIVVLSFHTVKSYIDMKRKIETATVIRDNVYETEFINSPFVFGIIKPQIYIPVGLSEREQLYLIHHEEIHIKRFDYIIKQIYFLAVIIHWFNPIVWKAFQLVTEDMEMSCDERVMKDFRGDIKVEYSESLLEFATISNIDLLCPLAFGENHVKKRIENVLKYKKMIYKTPKVIYMTVIFWAVFFISNPSATQLYSHNPYSLGQVSIDYLSEDSALNYVDGLELLPIRESIASFKSTGELRDIYVFSVKNIKNNVVAGFVDHSDREKTGVCVFEKNKDGLKPLYIELGKNMIGDGYNISGNFIIDYGEKLNKKALVVLSNGSTSIKANVYLNEKIVETKSTELNEPDMFIIDLNKYNYKDLSFKYFDYLDKEIKI